MPPRHCPGGSSTRSRNEPTGEEARRRRTPVPAGISLPPSPSAREQGPRLAGHVLVYPVLDSACATLSYERFKTGYFLERDQMALVLAPVRAERLRPGVEARLAIQGVRPQQPALQRSRHRRVRSSPRRGGPLRTPARRFRRPCRLPVLSGTGARVPRQQAGIRPGRRRDRDAGRIDGRRIPVDAPTDRSGQVRERPARPDGRGDG
jgi:hypothetical protein